MELALGNFVVVKAKPLWFVLVDQKNHSQYFCSEIFLLDCLDGQSKSVAQHVFRVFGFLNGFLYLVAATSFKRNSNCLFEFSLCKTLVEFFVNNSLHLRVNFDVFFFLHCQLYPLLSIDIDALMHEGVDVLVVLGDVKQITGFQRQSESVIMSVEVVENFACNAGGQLSLREALLVDKRFNTWNFIRDLVPLIVSNLVQFFQCVDLLVDKITFQHCQEFGG